VINFVIFTDLGDQINENYKTGRMILLHMRQKRNSYKVLVGKPEGKRPHGIPGGALNLRSTSYPEHGRYVDLALQENIPMAEPVTEHGTSWLVVRIFDHQGTRLVCSYLIYVFLCSH
jgi:hypothetical protein